MYRIAPGSAGPQCRGGCDSPRMAAEGDVLRKESRGPRAAGSVPPAQDPSG